MAANPHAIAAGARKGVWQGILTWQSRRWLRLEANVKQEAAVSLQMGAHTVKSMQSLLIYEAKLSNPLKSRLFPA
jgi:hypothetical protein